VISQRISDFGLHVTLVDILIVENKNLKNVTRSRNSYQISYRVRHAYLNIGTVNTLKNNYYLTCYGGLLTYLASYCHRLENIDQLISFFFLHDNLD
jgi:hypothetical protein